MMRITRKGFIALASGATVGYAMPPRIGGGRRWYKGMIHAHTCWSDGYAMPEQAVAAYKNSGYDFFSITDHNRIGADPDRWIGVAPLDGRWPPKTVEPSVFDAFKSAFPDAKWRMRNGKPEVRMSTMAEIAARFNEPGKFLFMPGCEITTYVVGADGVRCDLHMNCVGLDEVIPRYRNASLVQAIRGKTKPEVMREAKDQVDALAKAKGNAPNVFFVNHPHWRYYDVLPEDVLANPDVRFFEVCNNASTWAVDDPIPRDGFNIDRFWDAVNASRCLRGEPLLYGIATEDTHFYPGSGTSHKPLIFGDAWIGVRSDALTQKALFAAMDRGDFYAASGVDIDDIAFDRATGTLSVAVPAKPGVAYKVRFITTKRGVKVDPVKTVEFPAKGGKETARRVPIYSDGVGAVAKTVTFGKGEPVFASYRLADDDLYVRARVESDEATTYPYAKDRMHPLVKVAWTQPYRR